MSQNYDKLCAGRCGGVKKLIAPSINNMGPAGVRNSIYTKYKTSAWVFLFCIWRIIDEATIIAVHMIFPSEDAGYTLYL